jgi:hypothetical protein
MAATAAAVAAAAAPPPQLAANCLYHSHPSQISGKQTALTLLLCFCWFVWLCTGEDVLRADLPALITAEEVKSLEVCVKFLCLPCRLFFVFACTFEVPARPCKHARR